MSFVAIMVCLCHVYVESIYAFIAMMAYRPLKLCNCDSTLKYSAGCSDREFTMTVLLEYIVKIVLLQYLDVLQIKQIKTLDNTF